MRLQGSRDAKRRAKTLRRALTPPEVVLWLARRSNDAGLRFRKQYDAGEYVLDFYCAPARLCIGVDGEVHERGDQPERDGARNRWLEAQGVRTVRYTARDVLNSVEGVSSQVIAIASKRIAALEGHCRPPPPSASLPPPPGGGG